MRVYSVMPKIQSNSAQTRIKDTSSTYQAKPSITPPPRDMQSYLITFSGNADKKIKQGLSVSV